MKNSDGLSDLLPSANKTPVKCDKCGATMQVAITKQGKLQTCAIFPRRTFAVCWRSHGAARFSGRLKASSQE